MVRWQPFGAGMRTAEPDNVPFLVFARTGSARSNAHGDQEYTFGAGGSKWGGSLNGAYLQAGISTGYRMSPHALLYAGGALGQYWLRGEVAQDSTATFAGGTYVRSDGGHADSVGLGLLFNWTHFQFSVAADRTHLDYAHTKQQEDVYLHAGFYITPH